MKSSIAQCRVLHARHTPVEHSFSYPLYMFVVDLDELGDLDRGFSFFGYNHFSLHSIYDRDYLNREDRPVKEKLLNYLKKEGVEGIRTVYLATQPKFLGTAFNPVSFYFCYGSTRKGAEPLSIVCEVNNTFHERHLYILQKSGPEADEYTAKKEFHVSPFNNVKGTYHFRFADIRKKLDGAISLHRDGEIVFFARIEGELKPIEKTPYRKIILNYPLEPFLVIPRIFYQAFKLFFFKHLKYYDKPVPESTMTILKNRPTFMQKRMYGILDSMFSRIDQGQLRVILPEGENREYGNSTSGRRATIRIHEWKFFTSIVGKGDVGFGEAYVDGLWTSDDLAQLQMLFLDNYRIFSPENLGAALVSRMLGKISYAKQKNSVMGSRRNISRHYDLSNEFFRLFLDKEMIYSSGIFLNARNSLYQSQLNKVHALISKARISRDDHVLEIGCGWGGFALEAVRKTGCTLTAITVSEEQYAYTQEKVRTKGYGDKIEVKLCDYRHIEGRYSKIVSIEMAEAVGHQYLGEYLARIDSLLAPHGIAVLQIITMPDHRHEQYKREYDWIKKHIFPGGHLPCIAEISAHLKNRTELFIHDLENIGVHYGRTLKLWNAAFQKNLDRVKKLGFDEEFIRKWSYYLQSCEALFTTRTVNNVQLVLTRPNNYSL